MMDGLVHSHYKTKSFNQQSHCKHKRQAQLSFIDRIVLGRRLTLSGLHDSPWHSLEVLNAREWHICISLNHLITNYSLLHVVFFVAFLSPVNIIHSFRCLVFVN
jgi:hypothetical protein